MIGVRCRETGGLVSLSGNAEGQRGLLHALTLICAAEERLLNPGRRRRRGWPSILRGGTSAPRQRTEASTLTSCGGRRATSQRPYSDNHEALGRCVAIMIRRQPESALAPSFRGFSLWRWHRRPRCWNIGLFLQSGPAQAGTGVWADACRPGCWQVLLLRSARPVLRPGCPGTPGCCGWFARDGTPGCGGSPGCDGAPVGAPGPLLQPCWFGAPGVAVPAGLAGLAAANLAAANRPLRQTILRCGPG